MARPWRGGTAISGKPPARAKPPLVVAAPLLGAGLREEQGRERKRKGTRVAGHGAGDRTLRRAGEGRRRTRLGRAEGKKRNARVEKAVD